MSRRWTGMKRCLRGKCLFAAGLMLLQVNAKAEDDIRLGRLFTTPEERAAMEIARHRVAPPPESTSVPASANEALPTEPPRALTDITLNGVVVRSDGRSTVWVNGASSHDGNIREHQVQVNPSEVKSDRVPLRLLDQHAIVRLKPGETLSRSRQQ